MTKILTALTLAVILLAGCESLRFAPSEGQKQNAWLHNRTAAIAAEAVRSEGGSQKLQSLAQLSELQSRAFICYYGLPKEFPQAETAEDVLAESNIQLAQSALRESANRPDAFAMADSVFDLAIGISALLGGVYGTKAVRFLRDAKTKTQALKEIIKGNEIFKQKNKEYAEAFKDAQKNQSPLTKQIVAETKSGV